MVTRGIGKAVFNSFYKTALGRQGALGLEGQAAKQAAELAAARATANAIGVPVGMITEGGLEGTGAGFQVERQVQDMPFETLAARSPEYRALIDSGLSPTAARQQVAQAASQQAAWTVGSTAALLGNFGGHTLGHFLTRTESSLLGKTALSRTIRGGLGEATEESLQGGSGQYLQNLALRDHADTQQDLSAGVANAMAQGPVGVGPTGAFLGWRAKPAAAAAPASAAPFTPADHGPLGQALARALPGEDWVSEPLPDERRERQDTPLPRESGPPEPMASADALAPPDAAFPSLADPPASSTLSLPVSSPQAPPRAGLFHGAGEREALGRSSAIDRDSRASSVPAALDLRNPARTLTERARELLGLRTEEPSSLTSPTPSPITPRQALETHLASHVQARGLAATLGEAFSPLVDTAHQSARATVDDLHTWAEQGRLPEPGEAGWATVDAVARAHPRANPAQVTEITLARQASLPEGHPEMRRPLLAQTAKTLRSWGDTQAEALGVPQLQPWGESNRGIRALLGGISPLRLTRYVGEEGDGRKEDGRRSTLPLGSPQGPSLTENRGRPEVGWRRPEPGPLSQTPVGRTDQALFAMIREGRSARELETEVSIDGARGYYAKAQDRRIGEAKTLGAAPKPGSVDGLTRNSAVLDSSTPSGALVSHGTYSTAIGSDSATMTNFNIATDTGNGHNVIVHGSRPDYDEFGGLFWVDGNATNPQQIIEGVLSNPNYQPGSPICMGSCWAASNGTAQQVADGLGATVTAYTRPVAFNPTTGQWQQMEDAWMLYRHPDLIGIPAETKVFTPTPRGR